MKSKKRVRKPKPDEEDCTGDSCCRYRSHHACFQIECQHDTDGNMQRSIARLQREHPDWNIHR